MPPKWPICSDFDFGTAPVECLVEKKYRNCSSCRSNELDTAQFLNGGMFAGEFGTLYEMLVENTKLNQKEGSDAPEDDQANWHTVMTTYPHLFALDYGGALFFNLHGMPWSG